MGINPYLPVEVNEEPVAAEQTQEQQTAQASSPTRHLITGPNGEELPAEVQESLGRYLNPWGQKESSLPNEFKAVKGLFEFFAGYSYYQQSGTLLLAIADVVDDMSEGLLGRVYRLHEAERRIMWTQHITRLEGLMSTINWMVDGAHNAYEVEIGMFFDVLMHIARWYQEAAALEYVAVCEELGREPDNEFVQTGKLTERTHFQKIAMNHPPANKDV